ncbi:MAG: hypothetical protein U9N83_15225 [Thermodesulfobacteriota bacterium]|nr:hypothetical protein [Thermodesulfobacteriota bacterium]
MDNDLEGIDVALDHSRMGLAERKHKDLMSFHVDLFLDEFGVLLDKNSELYQMFCYETLKVRIRVLEADKRKLVGDFRDTDKESILKDLGLLIGSFQ